MSARFKNVDRKTPMLLPLYLRDWVAEDDLVHFVLDAVDRRSAAIKSLQVQPEGHGRSAVSTAHVCALLIYSYANGIFSSRKNERGMEKYAA